MTVHERCTQTMACQPTDRTPTYIPAISCHVSSELLGRRVHTGTGSLHYAEVRAWADGEAAHEDFERQLERDTLDIHRHLNIDIFRPGWRMNRRPTKMINEYTFLFGDLDGAHTIYQYHPDSADFSAIKSVPQPGTTPEQRLAQAVEADEASLDEMSQIVSKTVAGHARTAEQVGAEFFPIQTGGGIGVGLGPEAMMSLLLTPDLVRRRCTVQAKFAVAFAKELIARNLPPIIFGGGDLAGNTGMMYSPATFRDLVFPAYQHALSQLNAIGVHYLFRTDGNIWSIADMLFDEAACPGFGEVDRDASMTIAALRERYPKLVLWGNVSSQFLVGATPAQVRDETKQLFDESKGVGYFHGCSNAIVKGTPPANVEALFDVSAGVA